MRGKTAWPFTLRGAETLARGVALGSEPVGGELAPGLTPGGSAGGSTKGEAEPEGVPADGVDWAEAAMDPGQGSVLKEPRASERPPLRHLATTRYR
jgi:hypothetical protein